MNKNYLTTLLNLFFTSLISFLLIFLGLRFVSGSQLSIQNVLLLLGFCILVGIVSSLLHFLKLKLAYYIFSVGILIGLFEMYRHFLQNLSGWEDLTGLASLFVWLLIGLCGGLIAQLGKHFYIKNRKNAVK